MSAKNKNSGLPGDSAGTTGLENVDKILGLLNPKVETPEAIQHITRELNDMIQLLGKDKVKELVDVLDAGGPRLSPREDLAKLDSEKVGGSVGSGRFNA